MQHLKRSTFLVALAFLTAIGLFLASTTSQTNAASAQQSASISTIQSGEDGVQFTVNVPTVEISAEGEVSAPGLTAKLSNPGEPALPFYSTFIALPPEADATVTVSELSVDDRSVTHVRPAASIADHDKLVDGEMVTSIEADLGLTYVEDEAIYSADSQHPAALYEVSEPMYMRDLRVVQIKVFPVRYNAAAETLTHAQEINVNVEFSGSKAVASKAGSTASRATSGLTYDNVVNLNAAASWHALPTVTQAAPTNFPIGKQAFKIEVNKDGIYEVTLANLQAAGLSGAVNPNNLEMMHQGQTVAFDFIGDTDAIFEAGEKVRFYGWAFDGSRHDKQFVGNNVFWLWAGGSATNVASVNNITTGASTVSSFPESLTFEEDNIWLATYTNEWSTFESTEADTWYWDRFDRGTTRTYTVQLPHPATTGPSANFSAEIFSLRNHNNHRVTAAINGVSTLKTWNDIEAVYAQRNVPLSSLNNGANTITLYSDTVDNAGNALTSDRFYTNGFTLDYQRQMIADGNELMFGYPSPGIHLFDVSGFTTNAPANMIVWDISNRRVPKEVTIASSAFSGAAGNYTMRVGTNHGSNTELIATTTANAMGAISITKYVGSSIEPAGNGADWVAIGHSTLLGETNRLAAHRASTSGLTTHVVNVEDIYNQYGYGFEYPKALQDYMKHALADWTKKPEYLVISGDATHNPRQMTCSTGCSSWNTTEQTLVVTDLLVEDRFLGLIPSDHTFSTLVGNDIVPDISVGRITSKTAAEMKNTVDKIIEYDDSVAAREGWTNELLFIADNQDQGGNFCQENQTVENNYVPSSFSTTSYCLDNYLFDSNGNPLTDSGGNPITQTGAKSQMRADFFNMMQTSSAGIVNYRGHGSITEWAQSLVSSSNSSNWLNLGKPTVILSADCLDGNFAWPGLQALSETFLALNSMRASAAHWSSSGLGYSFEHSALHTKFYEGLYTNDLDTIGDAITYAKTEYISNNSGDLSEVYAFILQGDPAMGMPQASANVYLPIIVR